MADKKEKPSVPLTAKVLDATGEMYLHQHIGTIKESPQGVVDVSSVISGGSILINFEDKNRTFIIPLMALVTPVINDFEKLAKALPISVQR